ncbi:LAFE_0G05908g1_1 [Lachancea fermentati]|uniref:LAFE_0G05908g1_1 n=1 Tax=Lachancea fermentati TaxID=4955 RepID=A0A1G4MH65_LACFM|nr:LAFE_0G05908g1_1 [Lachancea fermentati]
MSERTSTEADDVLEFLESLPEGIKTTSKDENKVKNKDNEILDFLDELEQSNLTLNKDKKPKNIEKSEGSLQASEQATQTKDADNSANVEAGVVSEKQSESAQEQDAEQDTEEAEEEQGELAKEDNPLNDPITSFSNWWSSSGSATVNGFFSKTAEQANHLKDRLAQEQQGITSRLQTTGITSKINSSTISSLAKNLTRIVVGETDEVLRIHLVHDLVNYPLLSYHVEQQFDNVLSSQVQSGVRIFVDEWDHPHEGEEKIQDGKRYLNMFMGKVADAEKLAFANIGNAIKLFQNAKDELSKQRIEAKGSESGEELSISDIFVSILPVGIPQKSDDSDILTTDSNQSGNFAFTIVLKDITNDITSITRSQGFPLRWAEWLEGTSELRTKEAAIEERENKKPSSDEEGEEIDPSEWVKEWVEDGLSLAFGVVAQNYVIDRMGF